MYLMTATNTNKCGRNIQQIRFQRSLLRQNKLSLKSRTDLISYHKTHPSGWGGGGTKRKLQAVIVFTSYNGNDTHFCIFTVSIKSPSSHSKNFEENSMITFQLSHFTAPLRGHS